MNITVELHPVARADLPKLLTWRNDWRLIRWTRQSDLLNEVEHAQWFEKQALDPSTKMYVLVMKSGGRTDQVGVCGLTSIDYRNRRAEFSLYIANPYQGLGIGRASLKVLLTHGFENLGLNLIFGESFDENPAIKMFTSLGMKHEGTRRQFYFKEGKFTDAHLFSITADEWRSYGKPANDPKPADPVKSDSDVLDAVPVFSDEQRDTKPTPIRKIKGAKKGARSQADCNQ